MTIDLVNQIANHLAPLNWKIATAESCTAGGVAYALTELPGSSAWFERGFVTYSNLSKEELLGVSGDILQRHGAVSEETAIAMAEGALKYSAANVSLAITGIAGPTGGSIDKPVGTVWFAWSVLNQGTRSKHCLFTGDRQRIREQSIIFALENLLAILVSLP